MDAHRIEPALRDVLRETLDADLGPHPVWAGSPAARRVSERQGTRWPLRALAAAAVLVVAIGGYQLLPGGLPSGGATATPSPSPGLLARGDFVTVRGAVRLEATGQGPNATGRMTVSGQGWFFTVDLECARTTEDGLIMIGGRTTDADVSGSGLSPVGTLAAVVIQRGSPVQATVWSQRGGGTAATSCLGYLDERFEEKLTDVIVDDDDPGPVEGTIELGADSVAPSEAPAWDDPSSSGAGSLPVGPHVMGGGLHGEDRVTVTIPAPGRSQAA